MKKYERAYMQYNNYRWTTLKYDNPIINGDQDNSLFNRKEGYEVLKIINYILEKHYVSIWNCKKMEELIHNDLPQEVKKRKDVILWILNELKK